MVSRKLPSSAAAVPGPPNTSAVPHADDRQLERSVIDKFQSHPGLTVCSLVVHRCPDGLCVEGRVVVTDPDVNLAELLAEIETSTPILNRVMVSTATIDAP